MTYKIQNLNYDYARGITNVMLVDELAMPIPEGAPDQASVVFTLPRHGADAPPEADIKAKAKRILEAAAASL